MASIQRRDEEEALDVSKINEYFRKYLGYPDDISGHLETLFGLGERAKTVLELGTGSGRSTCAFLAAGCEVWTVDTEHCDQARMMAKECDLEKMVHFIQGDDMSLEWSCDIDLLFIDTSHQYEHTLYELRNFGKYARQAIVLHDIVAEKNVWDAIYEYLKEHPNEYIYECHFWNNGLGILRRQR